MLTPVEPSLRARSEGLFPCRPFLFEFFLVDLVHAFLDLFFDRVAGIVEFLDALADAAHQFGDFLAAEQEQNDKDDDEPLAAAGQTQQKDVIHVSIIF